MARRLLTVLVAALALCLAGCGKSEKKAAGSPHISAIASERVPLGRLSRDAMPTHYRITLTIDPAKPRFAGHTEIDVVFGKARRALFLHGLDLNISGAVVRLASGKTIPAHYDQVDRSGVARLIFVDKVPAGRATLIFDYDAPFDTSLAGLYKVVDAGVPYAFTQFENTDARRAFPSFDEPGFKTPFNVTVIAPAGDTVIANTPEHSVTRLPNNMNRTVFQTTRPLPTYLLALAVGPLDVVDGGDIPANRYRSRPVHVRGITAKGNGARIAYALSLTPKIVTALEDYFGIAYPFQKLDILAVPDFAAGAMENAGAITFRERLLLLDPNAPLEQKRATLAVQAHELTHQWFGDLVTPVWWDDIWLNESFANWMETKASSVVMPEQEYARETLSSGLDVMDLDELPSARQIHQPVNNVDDIDNAFDAITYDKGASVLAMFESYVGEEAWRRGIHAYLTRYASGNATAQDFFGSIAKATGHPEIVPAFASFIDQPGVPLLQVETHCADGAASLEIAQSMYAQFGRTAPHRLWGVPMCLAGANGVRSCQLVQIAMAQVSLGATCPAFVMPNDQGKGYYRFAVDENGWRALLQAAPKLSAADQLTLFANIDAALHAGRATATDYFDAIRIMAPAARWDLLGQMEGSLRRLRQSVLAAEDLPVYRAFVARTFAARLAALHLAERPHETSADTLARETLASLMATEARDPPTVAEMAKAARIYVNFAGASSGGMSPDVLPDAMRAGLQVEGAPFADALGKALLSSNSEYFRRNAIYAFAGSDDPALIAKLLALAPRMRTGELRYLFQLLSPEPVARAVLWHWLTTNYAAIVARVSVQGMGRAPAALQFACDAASRAELDAFFAPKVRDLEGVARPLALAEEEIGRCMAFKQAKGAQIAAALKAQK